MWLWGRLPEGGNRSGALQGANLRVALVDLAGASVLGGRLEALRGRAIVIAAREQFTAALALLELDGVARRMVLCPPDLKREHLPHVIESAGADVCLLDAASADAAPADLPGRVIATAAPVSANVTRRQSCDTEWVLLTSGTTGVPKLVLHTLASLSNALIQTEQPKAPVTWGTFYDIRRYGGLQIFLRALRSGSLVLSDSTESVPDFLARAGRAAVSHISGTPTHWRQALMSGAASRIAPQYVRLSGEVADQGILDNLRAAYPAARIAHAFASTEAGVAFEVSDGQAGFPVSLTVDSGSNVELRVDDGVLYVRSPGTATCYLGKDAPALKREDGFVTTGDRLERRGERYYFAGRSGGVINVGGLKVHPEEVEGVINSHRWVRMSLVRARRNPLTGALVAAEVVLVDDVVAGGGGERPSDEQVRTEIIELCRQRLPPHKVPAVIRIVPALAVSASGKLVRPNA